MYSICTQTCFQWNFQTIIPHLCLESAVDDTMIPLLFQWYHANLADMASLFFGNCTMTGSKGWPKHMRLFGWLNYCVFKHSCHKYPWMNAQGLGEKRTQVNCSGLVFGMNTIWGLLWFTTGSLDLTSPLYPTFFTEESGESAVNITFFLGLSLGPSTSYLSLASVDGCIRLLSKSCAMGISLAKQQKPLIFPAA